MIKNGREKKKETESRKGRRWPEIGRNSDGNSVNENTVVVGLWRRTTGGGKVNERKKAGWSNEDEAWLDIGGVEVRVSESEKEKQGERRTWVSSLSCELDFTRFWPPQSRVRTRRGRGVSSPYPKLLFSWHAAQIRFQTIVNQCGTRCDCVSDLAFRA